MRGLYSTLFATMLALATVTGCNPDTNLVGKIQGHSFSNNNGCSNPKRIDVKTSEGEEIAVCYTISNCEFEDSYKDLSPDCGLICGGGLGDKTYQFVVSPVVEGGKQKLVPPIGEPESTPCIPLYDLVKIEDTFDYPPTINTIGYVGGYSTMGYEVKVNGIDRELLVRTTKKLGGWGKAELVLERSSDKNLTGRPIYDAEVISLLPK